MRSKVDAMKIHVLIVDDEALVRKRIRRFLKDHADVHVVGECGDGQSAAHAIKKESPDLVFLDVQMPGLDGFGVLSSIGQDYLPLIIFVTAYDQYAVKAFDAHALDYLLKPFDRERFDTALERARAYLARTPVPTTDKRLLQLLERLGQEKKFVDRIVVRERDRSFLVSVNDIDWIEAMGHYERLHVSNDSYILREGMTNLEAKLDPSKFVRIHRSTIVNIDRIRDWKPLFSGECILTLRNGVKLTVSRTYRSRLPEI